MCISKSLLLGLQSIVASITTVAPLGLLPTSTNVALGSTEIKGATSLAFLNKYVISRAGDPMSLGRGLSKTKVNFLCGIRVSPVRFICAGQIQNILLVTSSVRSIRFVVIYFSPQLYGLGSPEHMLR